jgi:Flp pilus assembly protein TadG
MMSLFNSWSVKGRRGREAGGSLVEFALISPLLMAILFGMVDVGRWIFLDIEVTSAAHAGAQYGSLSLANAGNAAAIQTAAQNDAPDFNTNLIVHSSTSSCWCPSAPGTVVSCQTYPGNPCTSGTQIVLLQVNTQGTYTPWISFPPFTSNITIKGYAEIPTGQY